MFAKLEQRSCIKIEVARCHSTQECFPGLHEAYDDAAFPYRTEARWVKAFREDREVVRDNLCRGRPHVENNTVQLLLPCWMLIAGGLCVSIVAKVGLCHKTVLHILDDILS